MLVQIQHYLEEAKIRYTKFFERMQNYYQPERVECGDERWLHTVPGGTLVLTQFKLMTVPLQP